mmetsp:Transcript_16025/g.30204  ORF Transcript_16025/g.30204 Transcript_16025/m.30204 type:complete len:104 (-) Transcript_16025:52-363(-)
MDFVASLARTGVASVRGAGRSIRRGFLQAVYVLKEHCFGLYDGIADTLNCQKRRELQWRKESCVASFRHNSGALDLGRAAKPTVYDFTELQHGSEVQSAQEAD